jgi:hypothetical protein
MKRQLYEIWKIDSLPFPGYMFPWKAQMVNYIAGFLTEKEAIRYVSAIKKLNDKKKPSEKKK